MTSKIIKMLLLISFLSMLCTPIYANMHWWMWQSYEMKMSWSFWAIVFATIVVEWATVKIALRLQCIEALVAIVLVNMASYLFAGFVIPFRLSRDWSFELINIFYFPPELRPQVVTSACSLLLGTILIETTAFFGFCRWIRKYLTAEATRLPRMSCIFAFIIGNFLSLSISLAILFSAAIQQPDIHKNRMLANEGRVGELLYFYRHYYFDSHHQPQFFFHVNSNKISGIRDGYCFKIYTGNNGPIVYAWPLVAGVSGRLVFVNLGGLHFCMNQKEDGTFMWSGIDNPPPVDAFRKDENFRETFDFDHITEANLSASGQVWFSSYAIRDDHTIYQDMTLMQTKVKNAIGKFHHPDQQIVKPEGGIDATRTK